MSTISHPGTDTMQPPYVSNDAVYLDTLVDATDPDIAIVDGTLDPSDSSIMLLDVPTYVSGVVIRPTLITGYEVTRRGRNIVHASIDPVAANPYVSMSVASLRTGTLSALFANQADAFACYEAHALRTIFNFDEPDVPTMAMKYVVAGDLTIALDDETRDNWLVEIPFQEVTA